MQFSLMDIPQKRGSSRIGSMRAGSIMYEERSGMVDRKKISNEDVDLETFKSLMNSAKMIAG